MKFTYSDLIQRLLDVERLAEPPIPGEQGGCCSSYDRRSRYDESTNSYIDWDANDDGSGFIRKEGDWIVAFERIGPGVIWRVWSALPGAGHIQIFIDHGTEPVIDMPFRDFFERFNNEIPPLNFPDLTPTLSRGRNRFIPIPYNHACKIRLAPNWGAYYHFTYTSFPQGTELPVFDGSYDREAAFALAYADRYLHERGWRMPRSPGDSLDQISVIVPAHTSVRVHSMHGNRAIMGMRLALDFLEAADVARILHELTLSICWDGEQSPSVWSPLGAFFGTAAGLSYYRTLPLGVTDAGFYCYWFMPFAERADITITNDGDQARTLRLQIAHRRLERSAQELLRFHAKWHRDAFLERSIAEGRTIDWPLLLLEGQGRFCGIHLHVFNQWADPAQIPESWWYGRWDHKTIDWWWGEGDEKFFVDGEKFPSSFGTGSEDYIGYAWAAEPPFPTFDSPYAAQPSIALNANGHTAVSRFHICDDLPFQRSFAGYIERYKPEQWGEHNCSLYAVVAYWYQRADDHDLYEPLPLNQRHMVLTSCAS